MSFWNVLWLILVTYLLFAYLMLLFTVIGDLFRDRDTGGFAKALWIIALIFVPFFSLLLYLLIRGRSMSERMAEAVERDRAAQDAYVRDVAGSSTPAEQVAQAKSLLDAGTITPQEYDQLKTKALAG